MISDRDIEYMLHPTIEVDAPKYNSISATISEEIMPFRKSKLDIVEEEY